MGELYRLGLEWTLYIAGGVTVILIMCVFLWFLYLWVHDESWRDPKWYGSIAYHFDDAPLPISILLTILLVLIAGLIWPLLPFIFSTAIFAFGARAFIRFKKKINKALGNNHPHE